jgi:hypothetical protein
MDTSNSGRKYSISGGVWYGLSQKRRLKQWPGDRGINPGTVFRERFGCRDLKYNYTWWKEMNVMF